MEPNLFWIIDDESEDRTDIENLIKTVESEAEFLRSARLAQVARICGAKQHAEPTAIILDYMLGKSEQGYIHGIKALSLIVSHLSTTPIIMLTGESSVEHVLNPLNLLLKYRIFDGYFEKKEPRELDLLRKRITQILSMHSSEGILLDWTEYINSDPDQLTGVAGWMYKDLPKKAILDVPVIIQGPTGSGKELVARKLHDESFRCGDFITVDCGAIPELLFEIEFFGHMPEAHSEAKTEKKGFFELADGGTLFLDEVAELTPFMQAKLLRALEYGFLGSSRIP